MSHAIALALILIGGLSLAFVILFTSSGLFGYYIRESVRRILRLGEKKKVRSAFSKYMDPSLIAKMLNNPEGIHLSGDEKELSALFIDMQGFGTLAEGLSPAKLVETTSEYLSEMTEVIFKSHGIVDKYMGAAILAFWGAPFGQEDHALRACRAALDMQQPLANLKSRWHAQGYPAIDIRVGINTGPMWVGNMGSKRRQSYTIMGANVNMASRLKDLNKIYGTRLIIGESTYEPVKSEMLVRELDFVHFNSQSKPVRILELVAPVAEVDRHRDRISRFERGLAAYREKNWAAALEIFEALALEYPSDGPCRVFIKRCRDILFSTL